MKVVSWNVRGTCPQKNYILWKTLFSRECDIPFAVEHKCHDLARSVTHWHGYSIYYVGPLSHQYSGVVMIIQVQFCPQLVYNDPYRHFLVMEITYFGVVIWLVGIYALVEISSSTSLRLGSIFCHNVI